MSGLIRRYKHWLQENSRENVRPRCHGTNYCWRTGRSSTSWCRSANCPWRRTSRSSSSSRNLLQRQLPQQNQSQRKLQVCRSAAAPTEEPVALHKLRNCHFSVVAQFQNKLGLLECCSTQAPTTSLQQCQAKNSPGCSGPVLQQIPFGVAVGGYWFPFSFDQLTL